MSGKINYLIMDMYRKIKKNHLALGDTNENRINNSSPIIMK